MRIKKLKLVSVIIIIDCVAHQAISYVDRIGIGSGGYRRF